MDPEPVHPPLLPAPPLPPTAAPPPVLSPEATPSAVGPSTLHRVLAHLLSGFLLLFLASSVTSMLDDTVVLLTGKSFFSGLSSTISGLTFLVAIFIYGLVGLTPLIPKRLALPLLGWMAISLLALGPVAIYAYRWLRGADLIAAVVGAGLSLGLLRWLQGGWSVRWPLVAPRHLGVRAFSPWHLTLFVVLNLFVALPAGVAYVAGCASLAVSHFTDGFVTLRPAGLVLQARKYVRPDGRTILLYPMSHIANADFYQSVEASVGSNSVVLLEGVQDRLNRLTNHISYARAAKALNLSEQHEAFAPPRGHLVPADVDVCDFTSNTVAILNLVMQVHAEGMNPHSLANLLQFSPTVEVEQELLDDLLLKRNRHLLQELFARLPEADDFVIPWGAAHMAGLASEIQKAGFRLAGTRDFVSIRFGGKPAVSDWVPITNDRSQGWR